jgi:C-terminal processing protease CtpA/Prc
MAAGLIGLLTACFAPAVSHAQFVDSMYSPEGINFPCVVVGPLAPLVLDYCVHRLQTEGFLIKTDMGTSGLTVGVAGDGDGLVSAVAPGSPGARAGFSVGDEIVSVDGHPARLTAGEIAEKHLWGARGEAVKLTVQRDGAKSDLSFKRDKAPEPTDEPKAPNILVGVHPMMNWRGVYIPCMGVGPAGIAAIAYCESHYRQFGYVKTSTLGSTGLTFDKAGSDAAVVRAVEAGSPALQAGLKPGDVVTAIDGKSLTDSPGAASNALLFGKSGDSRQVVVRRSGKLATLNLVLGPPAS